VQAALDKKKLNADHVAILSALVSVVLHPLSLRVLSQRCQNSYKQRVSATTLKDGKRRDLRAVADISPDAISTHFSSDQSMAASAMIRMGESLFSLFSSHVPMTHSSALPISKCFTLQSFAMYVRNHSEPFQAEHLEAKRTYQQAVIRAHLSFRVRNQIMMVSH
jgi:hypothetical protein